MGMKYLQLLNSVQHGGLSKPLTEWLRQGITSRVCLSTSSFCNGRKKNFSDYEQVDQEGYASLVRSVISTKVSPSTPEVLFKEDSLLYGPVIKSKPPAEDLEVRSPQNLVPFANPEKDPALTQEEELRFPLKISLQVAQSKSQVPSVTHILQQTMPVDQAFYLERWKRRMIAELGEEGFTEYTAGILSHGKLFHAAVEAALLNTEPAVKKDSGFMESIQHILGDISGVRALESAVHHSSLQYLGVVDCVAEYRGKLCVIEWKTSEKPKPFLKNTFDNPLQVAAYAGAINYDNNYDYQIECGLIVIAYKDGSPARPHFMDSELCLKYWKRWLLRLEEFKEKKERSNLS